MDPYHVVYCAMLLLQRVLLGGGRSEVLLSTIPLQTGLVPSESKISSEVLLSLLVACVIMTQHTEPKAKG